MFAAAQQKAETLALLTSAFLVEPV